MRKAFFTVELALLMPVIFLSIFSAIALTFYVHDRSVLLSEASRAAWCLNGEEDKVGQADIEADLARHLIASQKAESKQTGSAMTLTVSASAHLPVSLSGRQAVTEKAVVRKLDAAKVLRLLRLKNQA